MLDKAFASGIKTIKNSFYMVGPVIGPHTQKTEKTKTKPPTPHIDNNQKVAEVGKQALDSRSELKKAEPSFFGRIYDNVASGIRTVKNRVVAIAIDKTIPDTKESDEKILQRILGNTDEINTLIKDIAPLINQFLPQIIGVFGPEFFEDAKETNEQLINRIILHLVANLSDAEVPKKTRDGKEMPYLTREELTSLLSLRLARLVGEEINQIDKEAAGKEPTAEKFNNLADILIDKMFPEGDPWWNIPLVTQEKLQGYLSEGLMKAYQPISDWLNERTPAPEKKKGIDLAPLKDKLNSAGGFLAQTLSAHTLKQDRMFFKQLTGNEDIDTLVHQMAPDWIKLLAEKFPDFNALIQNQSAETKQEAIEALVLRAMRNMAEELYKDKLVKGIRKGDVIPLETVVKDVFNHIAKEIKQEFDNCKEEQRKGNKINADAFIPLGEKLMTLFLPKEPFLIEMIKRHQARIFKPVSSFIFSLYEAQSDKTESLAIYKKRLDDALREKREDDVSNTVEEIFDICHKIAMTSRTGLTSLLADEKVIAEQMQRFSQIPEGPLNSIVKGFTSIFQGNDESTSWLGNQAEAMIEITLFKGIVHLIEKVPVEDRFPIEKLLASAFKLVLGSASQHFSTAIAQLESETEIIEKEERKKYTEITDVAERNAKIEKAIFERRQQVAAQLLAPFVNELIGFLYENQALGIKFEHHLPIPKDMQVKAADLMRKEMASLFGKMLVATTSWIYDRAENERRLEEIYLSKSPHKFCNALGKMAKNGVPYAFREKKEGMAQDTIEILNKWLKADNMRPISEDSLIQPMLKGFLHMLGHDNSPEMKKLMEFVGDFAEAAALRLAADLSEGIQEIEKKQDPTQPSLLESGLMGLLEQLRDHFYSINEARKKIKPSKDKLLARAELVDELKKGGQLHAAATSEAEQNEFFADWAKQLLKVLGVDANTALPIPDFFRSLGWEMLESKLMPLLLVQLFAVVKDPTMLNNLLLDLFNQIDISRDQPPVQGPRRTHTDDYQKTLEKNLGQLLQAVGEPTTLARWAFSFENVRKAAGEAMGQPLREEMKSRPLIDLIGMGMGKVSELINSKDPSYYFPTEEQKPIVELIKQKERRAAEAKLPKALHKEISGQIDKMAKDFFNKAWAVIKAWLNERIKDYPKIAKKIIMAIFVALVKFPLQFFIGLIRYGLWWPINQILKLYLKTQSSERANDVKLDIHDNLFYHLIENGMRQFAEKIEKAKQPAPNPTVT